MRFIMAEYVNLTTYKIRFLTLTRCQMAIVVIIFYGYLNYRTTRLFFPGYRSISLGLTGTESNHALIRRDVIAFLENELFAGRTWWSMFKISCCCYFIQKIDLFFTYEDEVNEFILNHHIPAVGAHQIERYAEAADMLSAAKYFNINIMTWSEYDSGGKWQRYTPGQIDSVRILIL